jgi:CheY-like chemotaxis protein
MESGSHNFPSLNVLLIGNNPMELGRVLEQLNQVRAQKIITEIAFDLKGIAERLMIFSPNFILIDDNIGRGVLQEVIKRLSGDKKTKNIPITVLKSSNYREALGSGSIMDYLLKQNLTADALYSTLKHSLRFQKTHQYLQRIYQTRKTELLRLSY